MRAVGVSVALAGVLWSLLSQATRTAHGGFRTETVFLWGACAGVAVVSLASGTPFRRAAWWGLVALLGQAASLQLIVAGPVVGYQHFRPFGALGRGLGWGWVGVLLGQFALLAWWLGRPRTRARLRSRRLLSAGKWSVLIGALFVLGATVSRQLGAYAAELALSAVVHALAIGTIVAAASSITDEECEAVRRRWSTWLGRNERWVLWAGAAWVAAVSALLGLFVYQAHPHVPDEVVYLYQARYFAAGAVTMPAPPVPAAFDVNLMTIVDGRWNGLFPPGWPALLAVGVLLHVPWLVNPLLAGVGILLAHRVMRRLYGAPVARIGTALLCVSPWYVFLGMSLMSHMAALVAFLLGAVAVLALRDTERMRWAALAGVAVGMVSLVRPLDGAVAALVLGIGVLATTRLRRWLRPVAAFVAAIVLVGGMQFVYNAAVTGDPLFFPLDENLDRTYGAGTNALGFGPNRGWGWEGLDPLPGHGPTDVVINADLNLTVIDVELFGWATGSLLLAALFLLAGRLRAPDWWILGAAGTVFAAYALYWFSGGPDFGARYWFLMIVPLVALTARGIEWFAAKVNGVRVAAAVGVLCIAAVTVFYPWRAVDKYYHYRGMEPGIRTLIRAGTFGNGLVLIQGRRHPDFASAAIYNPLDLAANAPVFAWDRSPEVRDALLSAFPDREVWIVEGPTVSGTGYRIVAGPLPATDLAEGQRP